MKTKLERLRIDRDREIARMCRELNIWNEQAIKDSANRIKAYNRVIREMQDRSYRENR